MVSGYYWRGQNLGGVSVQPSLAIAKSGLSLTAWGSVGLDKEDTKEFDLTLGYTVGNFSVAVTDYYFKYFDPQGINDKYFNYSSPSTSHVYEATLAYNFGPLALAWNTNFSGSDYYKEDASRAYSSYVEVSAPFTLGGVDLKAEAGAAPWGGAYTPYKDSFAVVNLALSATKSIPVSSTFSLPAFVKLGVNPQQESVNFVFGLKF